MIKINIAQHITNQQIKTKVIPKSVLQTWENNNKIKYNNKSFIL